MQVDVATGVATFTNVAADALGSYAIKVHIKPSTGSYFITKRAVLRVIVSQLKVVVKKSIQLKFAADFELIKDKQQQELFQAALENHFYKIYRTNQVIFSNFKFWQGAWLGGAIFFVFLCSQSLNHHSQFCGWLMCELWPQMSLISCFPMSVVSTD